MAEGVAEPQSEKEGAAEAEELDKALRETEGLREGAIAVEEAHLLTEGEPLLLRKEEGEAPPAGDGEAALLGVFCCVAVGKTPLGEGEGETEGDGLGEGERAGEREECGEREPLYETDGLPDDDANKEGVRYGDGVAAVLREAALERECEAQGEAEVERQGDAEEDEVGVGQGDGKEERVAETQAKGVSETLVEAVDEKERAPLREKVSLVLIDGEPELVAVGAPALRVGARGEAVGEPHAEAGGEALVL